MIHRIISALDHALFPRRCLLDAGPASQVDLADALVATLTPFEARPHCPVCGASMADGHLCGACLKEPPPFQQVRAAFWLDETLKALLHRMKYGSKPDIRVTRVLSELSQPHFRAPDHGALLPMPLHPNRLRQRGFNQSAWLARDWGRALRIPVVDAARRLWDTPAQARLDASARRRNLKNAFDVDARRLRKFKRIIIVDDVLTTGSSARRLAEQVLSAHPTCTVQVWVVARTALL